MTRAPTMLIAALTNRPGRTRLEPHPPAIPPQPKLLDTAPHRKQTRTDRLVRNADSYTRAVLTGELEQVLAAAPGPRNDTLNRAAFALGQLIGAQRLDHEIAHDELVSAAGRIGLPRPEAERTITSGLTAGARHPRQRST
jgi:hypothetical protein